MKLRIGTMTLICIVAIPVYMYDLVNYSINKNKEYIEELIKKETNQKVKLGNIHLSFTSLTLSEVQYENKAFAVNIKDIKVLANKSFIYALDPNKLVESIQVKNLDITPKPVFDCADNAPRDYSIYLEYIKSMKKLEIDKITYSNILNIDKTVFEKTDNNLVFNTTAKYRNNSIQAKGKLDLYKFLKTDKVDADILVNSNKIELAQFNQFINNSNVKLSSGTVEVDEKINIKDSIVKFSGLSSVRNLNIILFNKPMKVNDLQVKNSFASQKIEFEFKNNVKVNNTPFDIKKISLTADKDLQNIKHVSIESKNLNYQGTFSEKFNEDATKKEIQVKFNVVDLNYFNRIGLLDIPKPYNETIVKNGVFNIAFNKNAKKEWHMNYNVSGDASLKVNDVLFEADGKLEESKLSFKNFKLNKNPQEGIVNYDLSNDHFDLDIKVNVDRPIFSYIKHQYPVPFNIELLNDNVKFDLKLEHKDNQFTYNGSIGLMNNDVSFDYNDSHYEFLKSQGKIDFSTHQIDRFQINADKVKRDKYEASSVALLGSYKNNIIDVNLDTESINSKIIYDKNKDHLKIDVAKLSYEFKNQNKDAEPHAEAESTNAKSLELPKTVELEIQNLEINKQNLGEISLNSQKQENNEYHINTKLTNSVVKAEMFSRLDLASLKIKNNFDVAVDNIEKFNVKYNLNETIKDGDLKVSGEIDTSLDELNFEGLLDNSTGKIKFTSENGEFTKVNSNAGFVLNLLSFQTIPNLATLRFGNIFTNTFHYNSINGELTLNNSDLIIDKLDVKSKISDASLHGSIALDDQTLDIGLKVNPKVSNSILFTTVTIASGFNPIAILGTSLLEKIMPNINLMEYNYKINGTLDYPIFSDDKAVIKKDNQSDY